TAHCVLGVLCGERNLFLRVRNASPQRTERGAYFFREELRLFPCGKVATLIELVVVNQLRVGALRPTPRRLIQLVRKSAHGGGNRNVFAVEKPDILLPVQAR